MLITVDTNILVWGIRGESNPGQEEMIPRAQAFIDWVDRHKHQLALTSAVVGEFLFGGTEEERAAQLDSLQKTFFILDYDANSAAIAASIRSDPEFIRQCRASGKTRVCIASDTIIVATAKSHGVEKIFSNDSDVRKAAGKCGLPYADLPLIEAPGEINGQATETFDNSTSKSRGTLHSHREFAFPESSEFDSLEASEPSAADTSPDESGTADP